MSYNNFDNGEDILESEAMRKIFVGGLNRETTEEAYFDYFEQFGAMQDKVVIKDTQTKQSRGFGFITYDASSSVDNCLKNQPHILDGKTLDVKRAMPRTYSGSKERVTKIFIGGVSPDLTPEELQEYIESRHSTSIGTVSNIDFLKDGATGKNKGFGFMQCSDFDFADRLVICEAQFQINGKNMSFKKAEPKNGEGGPRHNRGGAAFASRGGQRGGGFNSGGRGRGGSNRGGRGNYNNYNSGGGGYGQQQQGGYGGGQQDYYQQSNNGYGSGGYGQQQGSYGSQGYNSYQGGAAAGGGYNQQQQATRYQPY